MKLKQPEAIRLQFARQGWLTIKEAAAGLKLSGNTIGKALRGECVRAQTIRVVASALGAEVTDIATFAN